MAHYQFTRFSSHLPTWVKYRNRASAQQQQKCSDPRPRKWISSSRQAIGSSVGWLREPRYARDCTAYGLFSELPFAAFCAFISNSTSMLGINDTLTLNPFSLTYGLFSSSCESCFIVSIPR